MLTPLSEPLERGSVDGKGGKRNHPPIINKKLHITGRTNLGG